MRGIPKEYTDWIQLTAVSAGRQTSLSFDGFTSDRKTLLRGLDQGCPLLGILYQFYNASLLDVPNRKSGEECTTYADDTIMMASGEDFTITNNKLSDMMNRSGGGNAWTVSHDSHFAIAKSVFIGFSC
ncbi:hypothetical protein K439DRAFT_1326106 [Ramaria rubella]|nr:hypothetical protein K439DRAFT_1326106 [Ramaria rubella]